MLSNGVTASAAEDLFAVRMMFGVMCNPCAWEGISSCRNSGVSAHPAQSGEHILDHAAHRSIS